MLSIILKRTDTPSVVQLTQKNIMDELWKIDGEMLTEDSWSEGLKKVRTPFVTLVEADCLLSEDYLPQMVNLLKELGTINDVEKHPETKRGGYRKLAMLSPAVGVNNYDDLIFGFDIEGDEVHPSRSRMSHKIGFVPGSVLRYTSIKDYDIDWDTKDLVKLSADVSIHLWNTNRRVRINPETTYVTTYEHLSDPFIVKVPDIVNAIFHKEGL